MAGNLDVLNTAVSLLIRAALLEARFSGPVRRRSLERLAAEDSNIKANQSPPPITPVSSRQETSVTSGRCLCSLLAACFRDGATLSHPCHSCTPAPLRTGQAAFPHPALQGSHS